MNRIKVEINRRIAALQSAIDDTNRDQNLKTIANYQSCLDHFAWEQEDGLFLIVAVLSMTIIILTIMVCCQQPQVRKVRPRYQ